MSTMQSCALSTKPTIPVTQTQQTSVRALRYVKPLGSVSLLKYTPELLGHSKGFSSTKIQLLKSVFNVRIIKSFLYS